VLTFRLSFADFKVPHKRDPGVHRPAADTPRSKGRPPFYTATA